MLVLDHTASSAGSLLASIPIEDLDPHPHNPRLILREEVVGPLSELLWKRGSFPHEHALIVRPRGARFQILAGHHRAEAARRARLTHLPCWVRDVDDDDAFLALVTTNHQSQLDPLEVGLHALQAVPSDGGTSSLSAYARKIGRPVGRVWECRKAASVVVSEPVASLFKNHAYAFLGRVGALLEISAAPQDEWADLVDWLLVYRPTAREMRCEVEKRKLGKAYEEAPPEQQQQQSAPEQQQQQSAPEQQQQQSAPPEGPPATITLSDAARLLGVPRSTLRRALHEDRLGDEFKSIASQTATNSGVAFPVSLVIGLFQRLEADGLRHVLTYQDVSGLIGGPPDVALERQLSLIERSHPFYSSRHRVYAVSDVMRVLNDLRETPRTQRQSEQEQASSLAAVAEAVGWSEHQLSQTIKSGRVTPPSDGVWSARKVADLRREIHIGVDPHRLTPVFVGPALRQQAPNAWRCFVRLAEAEEAVYPSMVKPRSATALVTRGLIFPLVPNRRLRLTPRGKDQAAKLRALDDDQYRSHTNNPKPSVDITDEAREALIAECLAYDTYCLKREIELPEDPENDDCGTLLCQTDEASVYAKPSGPDQLGLADIVAFPLPMNQELRERLDKALTSIPDNYCNTAAWRL